MNISEWWPKLGAATQDWLIANNGEVLQRKIWMEVLDAGRLMSSLPLLTDDGSGCLTDDEIDWIEATANDEN